MHEFWKPVVAAAILTVVVLAPAAPAAAQPAPMPSPAQDASPPPQPIKVTVVIARYRGETRTSNLPYTLWVNANDESSTNLRMSASVPIPSGVVSYQREGVTTPPAQINYQPLGTNIDCRVLTVGSEAYRVNLTVNDSSVAESPSPADGAFSLPPRILNFTSTNSVILRNGQSVEYISAADKATGEIVTLTVSIEVVREPGP